MYLSKLEFSLDTRPGVELLDHMATLFLAFYGASKRLELKVPLGTNLGMCPGGWDAGCTSNQRFLNSAVSLTARTPGARSRAGSGPTTITAG